MARLNVAIDLGGHTLIVARASGELERTIEIETPRSRSVKDVLDAAVGAVEVLCRECGGTVGGVCFAVPGMLDVERRHVLKMPNFPEEWEDFPIVERFAHLLSARGLPLRVSVENDANCYALGEGVAGEAVGLRDYVVLTLGTGIGCGIVLDGALLRGAHGMAGETGHIVVRGDAPCGCGGKGHAETLAAADGIALRARAAGLPGDFRTLWRRRGASDADAVLEVALDGMARTIASVCHILDPQIVVIGGGMSRAEGLCDALAERTRPYLSRPFRRVLRLAASRLGNAAALYGAAAIADSAQAESLPS